MKTEQSSGGAPTPYVPNTAADRDVILAALGLGSAEDLFADLPPQHRDPEISLPEPLSELELVRLFEAHAGRNGHPGRPSFLGAGAYRRFVPAVAPALANRREFLTAYTPYQAEISQGTLQAAFEYQSTVCELTGMEVSNTGLYDVAAATAEACLLAARVTRRGAVLFREPVHPHTLDVARTYALGSGLEVESGGSAAESSERHACLVVQQPDFLGRIVDIEAAAREAHAAGALLLVIADPLALGMLRSPGEAGADIVTAEGRDLAGPLNFGGPSLGIFATLQKHVRQVPGRIVGRTRELHGPPLPGGERGEPRSGYVLTLQAREQFIRRERATSNFSTGQALVALAFTIAVQALGPRGLRSAAELCYQTSHDAARRIAALPGFEVVEDGPWFQEFLVRGPLPPAALREHLAEHGITGGLPLDGRSEPECENATLFCVTEMTPSEHIDRLVEALAEAGETR